MGYASFSEQLATPEVVPLTDGDHPSFIGSFLLNDISICDRLIKEHKKSKDVLRGYVVKSSITEERSAEEKKKQIREVDLTQKNSFDLDIGYLSKPISKEYFNGLQECLELYKQIYFFSDKCNQYGIEGGQVQKYPKGGGFFHYHTEATSLATCSRNLVYMTYLNDVEDGGETEFFYQKLKVKPRKGLTLIWPSGWTHTHRGVPSMSEEKYVLTGWYQFVN